MTEIRPGLLLGSMGDALAFAARTPSVVKNHTVTHVLTLTNTPPEWRQVLGENDPIPFVTMFVPVSDQPSSDLLGYFDSCVRFIKEGIDSNGTVLVHCEHGVSRSPTVVVAYLMWKECVPLKVAMEVVVGKKPDVRPNAGFMEQLNLWDQMNCRIDVQCKGYKAYRLKRAAHEIKETGHVEAVAMSPDPFLQLSESSSYFRCRKCRRLLFTDNSVLSHPVGEGQEAFGWHKRLKKANPVQVERSTAEATEAGNGWTTTVDSETATMISTTSPDLEPAEENVKTHVTTDQTDETDITVLSSKLSSMASPEATCSSYFIEPVEWMEPTIIGCLQGKITCPKCAGRLGSFDWAGAQCSCGRWITPSFQIHKNKVDETKTLTKRKKAS